MVSAWSTVKCCREWNIAICLVYLMKNCNKFDQDVRPAPEFDCAAGEHSTISVLKVGLGLFVVLVFAGAYWALSDLGLVTIFTDEDRLRNEVAALGSWGIVVVIALMALAIVMSPIPSGPIAMVAGAIYGPVLGAIYSIIGAVLGAVIAFAVARCLGYDFVCRWLKGRLKYLAKKRSQNRLMGIVFVSRLIPFISFDAVSYAAGLTPLSFSRFVIATLAGVIPITFLLTFFGEKLIMAESRWSIVATIIIAGLTILPFALKPLRNRYKRRSQPDK